MHSDLKKHGTAQKPWWMRLEEQTEGEAPKKSYLKMLVAVALIAVVGYAGFQLFQKQKASGRDKVTDVIAKAQGLLPVKQHFGPQDDGTLPTASSYYDSKAREVAQRHFRYFALSDEKAATEYVDGIEKALAELKEIEGSVSGSKDQWLYWNTVQQLHWYAALNSVDVAKKKSHLQTQIDTINKLEKDTVAAAILAVDADPSAPGTSVLAKWKSLAEKELSFADNVLPAIKADEGLSATIEFEDGKKATLKFFSSCAPKTVETFVALAKSGFYNGTAIHEADQTEKTLIGGSALSRLVPNRPRVWHKDELGYSIPAEPNLRLPIKKGSIAADRVTAASHGSHFVVHLEDAKGPNYGETVFAEVTEGLDVFENYLKNVTVVTDADADNKHLPTTPLKIKSITVTGNVQYPSDDSWKAKIADPKIPELLPEEKKAETQPTSAPASAPAK